MRRARHHVRHALDAGMPEAAVTPTKSILILASITALQRARADGRPRAATRRTSRPALSPTWSARRPSSPASTRTRVFAETTSAMPGIGLIAWALDYRVDRARKDVTVTLFGTDKSRAVYRGDGLGCILDHGGAVCRYFAAGSPMRRRRCCLTSPALRSSRRQRRNWPPRSIAPLPSRTNRRRATRGRSWCIKDGRVVAERYAPMASVSIRRCSDSPPPNR